MKQDVDRLMGMVEMTKGKCNEDTRGLCADKPVGTDVSYFYRSTCETNLVPEMNMIRPDMKGWAQESRRYLYAAYSAKDLGAPRAYYLIFASGLQDNRAKTAYLNADGKIVELGLGCNVPMPMSSDHYSPIVPPAK